MADTMRGNFSEKNCSDCYVRGCYFAHIGEMVPGGKIGYFCSECWLARLTDFEETHNAKPLGTIWRLVPEEFATRELTITTKSGAIYTLGKPLEETDCLVNSLQKQLAPLRPVQKAGAKLPFDYAVIMLLRFNKSMLLKYFEEEEIGKFTRQTKDIWSKAKVYHTTQVVSVSYSENGVRKTAGQLEKEVIPKLFR